tara:strand:- start:371 stop:1120 length:750 start_codon:yes stop_codon:yes gene_type:complete
LIKAEPDWLKAVADGELHEAECRDFDLQESFDGVTFTDCAFSSVSFQCEEISACSFIDCQFRDVNFSSVSVRDCQFKNCHFYDSATETGPVFRFATVHGCLFERCDLSMADFSRANLYRSEFLHCQMQGADLTHLSIDSTLGPRVQLFDFSADQTNLAYCDWTGAHLEQASVTNCRLIHGVFNEVNLEGATLTDNEMHGISANGLALRGADLRGSGLDGLDVRQIDMAGVTIDEGQQRPLLAALGIVIV